MTSKYLAVAFTVALLSLDAHAQAVCEQFARGNLLDQVRITSSGQQEQLNRANLCVAEYDKATSEQKASIEASYKMFSGSAEASGSQVRERQRQMCDSRFGYYWFSQTGLYEQFTHSEKALDTLRACIEASSRGLKVVPTFTPEQTAFSASITWSGGSAIALNGITVVPAAAATCRLNSGAQTPQMLKPNIAQTFSCERRTASRIVNQETVTCAPSVVISVDSAETPFAFSLPERCDREFLNSRYTELKAQVDAIRTQEASNNRTQQQSIDRMVRAVSEANNANARIVKWEDNCPDGFRRVGPIGILLWAAEDSPFGEPKESNRRSRMNDDWHWYHPALCLRK